MCLSACVQYEIVYVCSCLRMCAVQLFPAVLLQYSRQSMMELSQPERYCITVTSLHPQHTKRHTHTYEETYKYLSNFLTAMIFPHKVITLLILRGEKKCLITFTYLTKMFCEQVSDF